MVKNMPFDEERVHTIFELSNSFSLLNGNFESRNEYLRNRKDW